jgi:hypothetical protein
VYQELSAALLAAGDDWIITFLNGDWGRIGGWGLFISMCVLITIGNFTELWVPGRRYRRLEVASQKISAANDELTKQNGQLIQGNELTKHFFEEMFPKRGVTGHELDQKASDSSGSG